MENLIWLFGVLPELGWGDPREFTGSKKDLILARNILESHGSLGLVFKRTNYLDSGGELGIYEWYDHLMETEDSYQTYMLKNYDLVKGIFQIKEKAKKLNELAGVFKKYQTK